MKRLALQKLYQWRENPSRKPLIVKGARQVGKTYLLKEFGSQAFSTMHYFNFEKEPKLASAFEQDLDPKRILQALSFHLQKPIDYQKDLIIFDEIQACPNALTSLKYFCEDLPGSHICCAGSLLGIYLGPVSFPVGKVEYVHLYPMTFIEFLMALGDDLLVELLTHFTVTSEIPSLAHDRLWERLKHYFIVGGLPEPVALYCDHKEDLFTGFQRVRQKQRDLIEDYFGDMAKHSGKINSMHINRIWHSIPEQLGRSQDGSAKKFKFKNVIPGIDRFDKLAGAIDWLESAELIIKVNIVNHAGLPLKSYSSDNAFKLFMFDIGILGALTDLNPTTILDYEYGSYKGFFAENYVAQAFQSAGVDQFFSWTEKTAEVEFLRQLDGHIIPIEVKSGWVTQAKSLQVFTAKYLPPYRVIFSAKPLAINLKSKLHYYPLYLASILPTNE